jgi:hypothetical protein
MVPTFWNLAALAAKTVTSACFHPEIGQLGLRIEMQAAGLRRRAELIAARHRGAMKAEKQNAPARRTGADALSAGLTALPVYCPPLAAGLLRSPA